MNGDQFSEAIKRSIDTDRGLEGMQHSR